jgi:uncharacterized membrane protein (DUF373 family)
MATLDMEDIMVLRVMEAPTVIVTRNIVVVPRLGMMTMTGSTQMTIAVMALGMLEAMQITVIMTTVLVMIIAAMMTMIVMTSRPIRMETLTTTIMKEVLSILVIMGHTLMPKKIATTANADRGTTVANLNNLL